MKTVAKNSTLLRQITKFTTLILIMSFSFLFNIKAQPPCNGMPQTSNTVASQNPVCPGVSFSVMLVGAPPQSGLTYQWFSSTDGNNFSPINGANAQQLSTSQLQSTYYRCRVTCTQSGMSAFSFPCFVTMNQPVIQYPAANITLTNGESTHPDNTGYVTFTTECCQGSVTYSDTRTSDCCQLVITRTWTIVDCYGYLTTYVQTITVLLDVSAPVITCSPLGPGACNTTPTPDPGSVTVTDQCPGTLTVATSEAVGPGCIVVTTFTWTATDQCGHSSSCTQTYSRIMDSEPPVITCPGLASLPCNTTPTPSAALITATDNCGTPEIGLIGSSSSTTGCLVTYVFTWRAIDACGNFADCNQILTSIHDEIAPVISCPNPVALPCNTTPTPSASLISATDNCGTPVITLLGTSSSNVACTTTYVFTWRATDVCGNFADCDQILTSIHDEIAPVITCPDPVALPCNTIPTPSASLISATDNCGTPSITLIGNTSSTVGCVTTYVFSWRAMDACGNFADCDQILTVINDIIPPVIICPAPVTLPCNVTPTPSPALITATDNCGTPEIAFFFGTVTYGGPSPEDVCLATYVFRWRATDDCGNFADCNQVLFSIHDLIPPSINCGGPIALPCNTTPTPSPSLISYQDNCGTPTITLEGTSSSTVGCLTTTVFTWRATDACGNFAECNQVFTSIFDIIKPVITCPESVTLPCNTIPVPNAVLIAATDNCGIPDITYRGTTVSLLIGCTFRYTQTWRATDACGNFAECEQVFFVDIDLVPPVIKCPDPDTLCNVTPTPSATVISATDNCGFAEITYVGTTTSTVGCVTIYNFTWKAIDDCGNEATCVQVIYVINDLIDPVIHDCPNPQSVPNDEGLCGAFVSWTPPTATDNCGLRSFTSNYAPNSYFLVGTTTVTYTAIDLCGHVTTCSFDILVEDLEPPWNMHCPGVIIKDNDLGLCSAIVTWNATATDNCEVASIVSVPASGSIFPVGVTPVIVTATDIYGNTWTCTFNVHVNDKEKPVFVNCPGPLNLNTDVNKCTAFSFVAVHIPDAVDNCEIDNVELITPLILDFPVGITIVKFKATDIHGNFQICTITVTVIDDAPPVIKNCPTDIRVNTDPGTCKAKITWVEPTATDNCDILSFTSNFHSGDDFLSGEYIVIYTATDIHGNISTCMFIIDVDDVEKPYILSHDIVTCDSVVFYDFIIGDNCMLDHFFYIPPSGSVFYPGTTTQVYVEAWDNHNNREFKYFDVTVLVPPSVIDSVKASSNEICLGDSITLTVYFDTLGTGGVLKLYKDFCTQLSAVDSSVIVDNSWSLKVKPTVTGVVSYYARIEGYCDTTDCFPITITVNPCPVILQTSIFLDGYYLGGGLMSNCLNITGFSADPLDADSIFISAMDANPPYPEVDRQPGILKTNGYVTVTFGTAVVTGNSYYLKINHRNSIETWSKVPVLLTTSTTYLFSSAATQAYGDNQITTFDNVGYAIFSGDINQDKAIDISDFLELDPHIQNGDGGYIVYDINGDGAVDISDFLLLDPNIQNGIGAAIP